MSINSTLFICFRTWKDKNFLFLLAESILIIFFWSRGFLKAAKHITIFLQHIFNHRAPSKHQSFLEGNFFPRIITVSFLCKASRGGFLRACYTRYTFMKSDMWNGVHRGEGDQKHLMLGGWIHARPWCQCMIFFSFRHNMGQTTKAKAELDY